jgi:hypothetical protein
MRLPSNTAWLAYATAMCVVLGIYCCYLLTRVCR